MHFQLFHNEVKSGLSIKETYSKRENCQSILLDNNKISTVSTFKINRQF